MFYPEGGLVVAMFGPPPEGKSGGGMTQLFEPFARVVEDVEGPDSVWVHAVESYVALQRASRGSALRKLVEARRIELAREPNSIENQAILADLQSWLDVTKPRRLTLENGARWMFVDMMDDTAAILGAGKSDLREVLRCKRDSSSIEVYALGREGAQPLALDVGGRRFAATPTAAKVAPDMRSISAELPFDASLSTTLRSLAGAASITVDGEQTHNAIPGDVLEKFALRCASLQRK